MPAPHNSTETFDKAEAPEIGFWDVFDDIQDSYALAMRCAGVTEAVIEEVTATVKDFAINSFGDD